MKLNLRTANASERLFWQHRINDCHPPVPIEWVYGWEEKSDKVIWVISTDEAYETLINSLEESPQSRQVAIIVTEEWQFKKSSDDFHTYIEALKAVSTELILESEYEPQQLYQCLFKPRSRDRQERLFTSAKKMWEKQSLVKRREREVVQPRLKLCVFGEAALAYELGAVFSMQEGCRVLLMDLDRLQPTADVYVGVKPIVEGHYDFFSKTSATGLNVLLDCAKKGSLHGEIFSKCTQAVKGYNRFEVLTGVYQQGDYEYYRAEDLKPIVERAAGYYDVILLKTNSFLYDGFTLMAMKLADEIVAGLEPDIANIRAYRQMVQLLKEKQDVSLERQFWVLFEDKKVKQLESGFFESLAGRTCIGKIPVLEARSNCRATGNNYLKDSKDGLKKAYQPVVKALLKAGETL